MKPLVTLVVASLLIASCSKKEILSGANLVFIFKFDSTQARLNNIGQPSTIAAGNAALSPVFNSMSAHYLELAPTAITPLGKGTVLYRASETTVGGTNAIDFSKANLASNNEQFISIPLKDIAAGDYEWLRLSLAYQNYDIKYRVDSTINGVAINQDFTGTVASFIGFNSYISTFKIKSEPVTVNANRKQGYWGFETSINGAPFTTTGQAPDGATTVVNPLFSTSPVPAGSCVVTAAFAPAKLHITGNETKDITIEVSLSTNKSFEWKEVVPNGKWDLLKGEQIADMGIRGMIPRVR